MRQFTLNHSRQPRSILRFGVRFGLLLVCLTLTGPAHALTQPGGPEIPVLDESVASCDEGGNAQVCLDEEEGGDNDFDDLLTRVSGIRCFGGGAQ